MHPLSVSRPVSALILWSVAVSAVFGVAAQPCAAEVVVQYESGVNQHNPNGAVGPYFTNPVAASGAVVARDLEAGIGDGAVGLALVLSPVRWGFSSWGTTSYQDAVAQSDVWHWGFEVDAAATISLESLEVGTLRNGAATSPDNDPNNVEIRVSINGSPEVYLASHDFGDVDGATVSWKDLGGIDLTGLATLHQGDQVLFTLAGFSAQGGPADEGGFLELRQGEFLTVHGNVVLLPEPSAAVAALLFAMLTGVKRRQP
ncbi:MAG: hypothetical protein KDA61_05890 [Planctomycetales bacterium]|nr:hypothetical protein [Planctomycetales bacterium]